MENTGGSPTVVAVASISDTVARSFSDGEVVCHGKGCEQCLSIGAVAQQLCLFQCIWEHTTHTHLLLACGKTILCAHDPLCPQGTVVTTSKATSTSTDISAMISWTLPVHSLTNTRWTVLACGHLDGTLVLTLISCGPQGLRILNPQAYHLCHTENQNPIVAINFVGIPERDDNNRYRTRSSCLDGTLGQCDASRVIIVHASARIVVVDCSFHTYRETDEAESTFSSNVNVVTNFQLNIERPVVHACVALLQSTSSEDTMPVRTALALASTGCVLVLDTTEDVSLRSRSVLKLETGSKEPQVCRVAAEFRGNGELFLGICDQYGKIVTKTLPREQLNSLDSSNTSQRPERMRITGCSPVRLRSFAVGLCCLPSRIIAYDHLNYVTVVPAEY